MKKWIKVLLWILWVIILLLVWAYCYMTYIISKPIHFCPAWYYPIISVGTQQCNACELTRKQVINWEVASYNDICRSIERECYVCHEKFDKTCHCEPKIFFIKTSDKGEVFVDDKSECCEAPAFDINPIEKG